MMYMLGGVAIIITITVILSAILRFLWESFGLRREKKQYKPSEIGSRELEAQMLNQIDVNGSSPTSKH